MDRHSTRAHDDKESPPPFTIPFHLLQKTPTKRNKRASFSPRKYSSRQPRTSDPFPAPSPSQMKSSYDGSGDAGYKSHDPFDPFTLWDDSKKSYRRPSQTEQEMLYVKLLESFPNLSSLSAIFPWCVLEFDEALPPYDERPFLVAGLVAVYLLEGKEYPIGTTYMGSPGRGTASIDPDHISQDLTPYHVPSFSTFEYLHSAVESAQHISSYPKQLLFELAEMPDSEFDNILSTLPRKFGSMTAYYVNGEFVYQLASPRVKMPNPELGASGNELIVDDSNYLADENGGKIHPGVLLECRGKEVNGEVVGKDSVNTGLAVIKDREIRLTCPSHIFDKVSSKIGYHHDLIVGELDQIIGEDIGLLEPVVPLSNEFLSVDCIAKRLVKAAGIADDDIVSVDSCFTGPQRMLFVGTRTGKRNRRTPGPTHPNYYVVLEQGIYTSSDPIILKSPVVRMGICGTPLLRIGNKRDNTVVAVGDVLGFFLRLDEKSFNGRMLYSYAQPCDPLIDAGWEIADVDQSEQRR